MHGWAEGLMTWRDEKGGGMRRGEEGGGGGRIGVETNVQICHKKSMEITVIAGRDGCDYCDVSRKWLRDELEGKTAEGVRREG